MDGTLPLSTLVERGGVYYNVGGSNPVEALGAVCRLVALPPGLDREALFQAVLEREALMPTAIGGGVAIPHPRNPLVAADGEQRVAVCFLKTPVPYNALDRKPVSVLFLILSAGAKNHLAVLAEISHLVRDEAFLRLLSARPSTAELAEAIARAEASWSATA